MLRKKLTESLVRLILRIECNHPTRVAVDGIDAAGKTMLADEIGAALVTHEREVIRASIDGFHRPRRERYYRGELSPEGYYHDSFDIEAIKQCLLLPLGPDGTGEYHTKIFDFRHDSPLISPPAHAPEDSILLFDGVFLLRPELNELWDLSIFVQIDFSVSLQRALNRDLPLFGTKEEIIHRYEKRYIPGQRIYLREAKPQRVADIVIDNNDPNNPEIISNDRGQA
ncbi:MAG: uridine kinase [candidate division WOR-3 bacterium]|nr:MAG: uridine kinase [candidate division WOR-3 bacterium]